MELILIGIALLLAFGNITLAWVVTLPMAAAIAWLAAALFAAQA
ncbi:MAG: hypothetical protein Q7V58_07995 [Actinomycetota bacterium]|nr:hypothetical protein [Actinomycetota bacterium]